MLYKMIPVHEDVKEEFDKLIFDLNRKDKTFRSKSEGLKLLINVFKKNYNKDQSKG